MKKRILSILKFSLFFGLGIFLVWLSVKDFSEEQIDEFYRALGMADYSWIILSMILGIFSHVSRAIRWIMLMEPVGYKPGVRNTFFAVMVGYLANFAFPRLGEVTRCTVLTKYEKVPFPQGFGTVIAERAFDTLCLGLIFLVTLYMQFDGIYALVNEHILFPVKGLFSRIGGNPVLFWGGIGFLGFSLIGLFLFRQRVRNILGGKVGGIIKGFWEGLVSIRKLRSPGLFLMHTVIIWTLYYVMLHVCFYSFEETSGLRVGQGMAVLIMGAVGIMFTQGGIGGYHLLVSKTLTSPLAGISVPIAGAFCWIVWASQFVTILIAGSLSLILLPILNKEK
ncbi:MAG: flippase-like domain-containing protein [Bacteroidia bacterium]|nr:flippase-like domain-containing protein [Bacteroidia bacterium]